MTTVAKPPRVLSAQQSSRLLNRPSSHEGRRSVVRPGSVGIAGISLAKRRATAIATEIADNLPSSAGPSRTRRSQSVHPSTAQAQVIKRQAQRAGGIHFTSLNSARRESESRDTPNKVVCFI